MDALINWHNATVKFQVGVLGRLVLDRLALFQISPFGFQSLEARFLVDSVALTS